MRVYDTENKNKLVKTFTMKWKKGTSLKEFSCEEKCNDIEFNHIYMGQIVMDSGDVVGAIQELINGALGQEARRAVWQ